MSDDEQESKSMLADVQLVAAAQARIEAGLSPIAHPLAGEKLTKKCLKLVKKASGNKAVRRGVKECVKAIRKGEKGVMILAGNITPIDVISHVPVLCEEHDIPYVYVPRKEDLGAAALTRRSTSCILVTGKAEQSHLDYMQAVLSKIGGLAA